MFFFRCNMGKCPLVLCPHWLVFLSFCPSHIATVFPLPTFSDFSKSASPSPVSSSVFLGKIKEAFDRDAELQNLLLDNFFSNAVQDCQVKTEECTEEWGVRSVLRKQPSLSSSPRYKYRQSTHQSRNLARATVNTVTYCSCCQIVFSDCRS